MLRPAAAFRPPHKHGTQIKKKCPRHLDASPAKSAGGVAVRKKKAALKPSFFVGGGRGRRQNEEDLMLGLLEEMGARMTQEQAGLKEEDYETEVSMRPLSSDEEDEEQEDVEEAKGEVEEEEKEEEMEEKEQRQEEKPKATRTHYPIPSIVSTVITTGGCVSPHELWNPTLYVDKGTLNLPWWDSSSPGNSTGGSSTRILALPPPPPPHIPSIHPHVEVARTRGVKELVDWFIGAALRQGNAADRAVLFTPMTSQLGKIMFLRRSFQIWMQDNKLQEREEKEGGRGLAVGSACRRVLTDPVLPQTATCQQDLGLAKALTGEVIKLPPDIAVELCEALGLKALALVSSLHEQTQHPPFLASSIPPTSMLRRKQSRLDQPPVLRSRHHAPCLYLPLSTLSDARLTLLEKNEALDVSLLKGHALRINEKHYQKLKTLYTKQHISRGPPRQARKHRPSSSSSSSSSPSSSAGRFSSSLTKEEEDLFHERLGCLLFRYQALAATGREDPSFHDADDACERSLPPRVFDVLASLFGAQMECFASPFNCRYSVFCSSQWDLDGYFGSVGSFFAFQPLNGMYVAHPPPLPTMVECMVKHMDRLLARCGPTRHLGFIVVVPSAFVSSSVPILNKLLQGEHPASSFLAWSLTVPADQYAFVAGSDHYQPRHYVRPEPSSNNSDADLLLLALLSPGARASSNYELTGGRQRQLLEAFASFKHEEARDSLGPPPPDMILPVSAREKEKDGGAEEWWW
ncbi:phosphorylated ctd-interacting factor 1-like [Nannochloropsis oceanica]